MTLIALPVRTFEGMASQVFDHFGRADTFALVEVTQDNVNSVQPLHYQATPGSDQPGIPGILADMGVAIALSGNIGPCLATPLLDKGIRAYAGAHGTITDACEQYLAGELREVKKNRYSL